MTPLEGLLVNALRVSLGAMRSVPPVDCRVGPELRTTMAFAAVVAGAALGVADGRPTDPRNTELMKTLEAARDGLAYLLPLAPVSARMLKIRDAQVALVALTHMIGPPGDDAAPSRESLQFKEMLDVMSGGRPCDTEPA
jgi:hypothetical protein